MKKKQTAQEWFAAEIEELQKTPDFALEMVLIEVANQIAIEMDKQCISKSDLARKMNKKPSYITRVLKGETNLTFSTAVQVAFALGFKLKITFESLPNEENEISLPKKSRSSRTAKSVQPSPAL